MGIEMGLKKLSYRRVLDMHSEDKIENSYLISKKSKLGIYWKK